MDTRTIIVSVEPKLSLAAQAVALGSKHDGAYEVLPRIGVISGPVEYNGWTAIPREQDTSYIPRSANRHVKLLRDNDFSILQEIVLHEPKEEKPKRDFTPYIEAAKTVGKAAAVVAGVAATATGAFLALCAFAITHDPALVVVLEDGTWLCVAHWRV